MEGYRNEAKILQQRLQHVHRLIRRRERESHRDHHTLAWDLPEWDVRDFDEEDKEDDDSDPEDPYEHFQQEEEEAGQG